MESRSPKEIGRRQFIKMAGVAGMALVGAACAPAAAPTAAPAATSKPAAATVAAPTAAPAAAQATPTFKPATVKMGSIKATSDAGIYVAMERGYFTEQGITMETRVFGSGAEMLAPITTGDIDMYGSGIATGILAAIDRGIGLKVVADKGTSSPGFEFAQIVLRKDLADSGQIKDIKDIKGKKVAVTSLAGNSEASVAYMIKQANLTIKDIDLMPLPYVDMIAALTNKGLDAADMTEPTLSRVIANGSAVKWPQGARSFTYGGKYQAGVLIFSAQFAKNVDVARRFMIGYLKGIRDYNDAFIKGKGKSDIIKILTKYTALTDPAQYEKMEMPGLNPDGTPDIRTLGMDFDYFKQMGYYTGKLTINDVVDTQFAEYAAKQLGPYK